MAYSQNCGLVLQDLVIWHYDQIRVLLDNSADVRTGYAAWITPGDVLSSLMKQTTISNDTQVALEAHAAKLLLEDLGLNLTQAGTVSDNAVQIADVYIDLPAYPPEDYETEVEPLGNGHSSRDACNITAELVAIANQKLDSAAVKADIRISRMCRIVLVGGPGQGKSTVTQYLTQLYRASFLSGASVLDVPEIRKAQDAIVNHAKALGLSLPSARRWPFRIVLTELADGLSESSANSVLEYISRELSKRSSSDVALSDIRAWLKAYPWLIIFDGLDEVPESSNRAEVLSAISDFYIDARGLGADVSIITTTRPQGYNDDFGIKECRHYELAPLPIETALAYAEILIARRLGEDSRRATRVRSTLAKAAQDDSTSNLMTTPLQTTILSILVERLGHAPKDRWRLFSSYYRVIYQREQEKGGDLAEMLQEYESDIHAIHYEIGFILQRRGETSGDSTSSISKLEFIEFIAARMIRNGNSASESHELASKMVRLATDRLVFLAVLRNDAVGFEIRSLQEYMAAERIVTGPESTIGPNVRAIAESAYWQNVLLFVAGSIFANKDHLCAEIVALCDDLNSASSAHKATLAGSRLAYALLTERIAITKPRYSRLLATLVTNVLRLAPDPKYCSEVAALLDLGHRDELESALAQASVGSRAQQLSATLVLSYLEDRGEIWAKDLLHELASSSSESLRSDMLAIAVTFGQSNIVTQFPSVFDEIGFTATVEYITKLSKNAYRGISNFKDCLPAHVQALVSCDPFEDDQSVEVSDAAVGLQGLEVRFIETTALFENLTALYKYKGTDPDWKKCAAIARCASDYDAPSLALGLSLARTLETGALKLLSRILPWPFNACVNELVSYPDWLRDRAHEPNCERNMLIVRRYQQDRADELIEAVVHGDLGDKRDWIEALGADSRSLDISSLRSWAPLVGNRTGVPLPVGRAYPDSAVTLTMGGTFSLTHNETLFSEIVEWAPRVSEVLTMMPAGPFAMDLLTLLRFVVGMPVMGAQRIGDSTADAEMMTHELKITISAVSFRKLLDLIGLGSFESTSWTRISNVGYDILPEVIHRIASAEYVDIGESFDVGSLSEFYKNQLIPWRVARLLMVPSVGAALWPTPEQIDYGRDKDCCDKEGANRCESMAQAYSIVTTGNSTEIHQWMRSYLPNLLNDTNSIFVIPTGGGRRSGYGLNLERLFEWLCYERPGTSSLRFSGELALHLINAHPMYVGSLGSGIYRMISARRAESLTFESA